MAGLRATVAPRDLRGAMKHLASLIYRKSTIPQLQMVKIVVTEGDGLTITATDLDIWLTMKLEATDLSPGAVLVDARTLADLAKVTPDPMTISATGETVEITDGWMATKLRNRIPVEDYPLPQGYLTEDATVPDASVMLSQDDVSRILGGAIPAISTEETRYYLNGIFLTHDEGNFRAVSTDGHHMAVIDSQHHTGAFGGAILPAKAAKCLHRLGASMGSNGSMHLNIRERYVKARGPAFRMTARAIDGTFPDYRRVLPAEGWRGEVHVTREFLRRITALATEFSQPIVFDLEKSEARARSPEGDEVRAPVTCGVVPTCEPMTFGISHRLLLRQAGITPSMTLRGTGPGDPFRITSDDPQAMWVLMPMRV